MERSTLQGGMMIKNRGRRLRQNHIIRDMVADVHISTNDLVYPLFIEEDLIGKTPINSMKGIFRLGQEELLKEVEECIALGIKAFLLFGIPKHKDCCGTEAYNPNGIIQKSVKLLKENFKDILIITDVCMCEYTSHGHCGILEGETLVNDKSAELMAKIALSHAQSGADIVAPSDMMDGRVGLIRNILDENGFTDTIIMSYAVKYASSFYGPFRDACDSTPSFGDRKAYQMDFRRGKDYLTESLWDLEEGADILMVKPGLPYLDILSKLREKVHVPLAVYNVSGEYAMVKEAAEKGYINEKGVVLESMYSFKRAGADIIITYWAKDIAKWLKGN